MIKKLLALGATYTRAATVDPDRIKAIGRMWDGKATLELNGTEFTFQLWHHGSHEETLESLLPEFSLKGIRHSGECYDICWHTIITEECIWLHPTGWFRDMELREHPLVTRRGNSNLRTNSLEYTAEEQEELLRLGFIQLVVLKQDIKEQVRCYQYQRLQTLIDRLQSEVRPTDDAYAMNCHWIMVRSFVESTAATAAEIESF